MAGDGFGEAKPLGAAAPAPSPQAAAPSGAQPFDVFASPVAPPPSELRMPDAPPVYHQGMPPPPPTGMPMPPPPMQFRGSTERNWMGIVSLVLGLLGGGLLGLGFGIAGLSAVKAGRATNRTMAIWGIVLNCTMWIAYLSFFGALAALDEVSNGDPYGLEPDGGPVVGGPDELPEGYVDWSLIAVGDCFQQPMAASEGIYGLNVVPCDGPHYGEVYFVDELARQAFVSDEHVIGLVDTQCMSDAATAGIATDRLSELVPDFYYPLRDSWDAGDRTFHCFVRSGFGSLYESVLTEGQTSPGVA